MLVCLHINICVHINCAHGGYYSHNMLIIFVIISRLGRDLTVIEDMDKSFMAEML